MKESIYIETSILGYLTARSTRDLVVAGNIETTNIWWNTRRADFVLYTSQAVLIETAWGDAEISERRLAIAQNLFMLDINSEAKDLAKQFLLKSSLPSKAEIDAIHIAIATVHSMNYLLTWNCKHIANAQIQRKLAEISTDLGYQLPLVYTPYELLGE